MRNIFLLWFLSLLILGCGSDITKVVPPLNEDQEDKELQLPAHWSKQAVLTTTDGVELYRSTQTVNNKKTNMFALIFDPNKVEFKPVLSPTAKRVSAFYEAEDDGVYAAVNGGFFGPNVSYSLVMYNGEKLADNIPSLSRNYNGNNVPYYPTRAAFGLNAQQKPSVGWIYAVNPGGLYIYPTPSPNKLGEAPQAVPTMAFPSGGRLWDVRSAIGGSPVLVRDSQVRISDAEELIVVDNTSSRPRTALGYLPNGLIAILVAEGGNSAESIPGLTLLELANQMKDLGCEAAINLDGGGSSALVVDGNHTIKPSDAAGERAVVSAIVIRKK